MIKLLLILLLLLPQTCWAVQGYKTRYNPHTSKPDFVLDTTSLEVGSITATGTITGSVVSATTALQLGNDYITDITGTGLSIVGGQLTATSGSGDITSVGDVASGAAFDGTQGTTLTFNNAGGDATIDYDGTDFSFSKLIVSPGGTFSTGTTTLGTLAGAIDAGGATSLEVPNTAGDITVDAAGEIAVDSTNKQLVIYDGAAEAVIPLRHVAQGTFDLAAQWDVDSDLWLVDLHADTYPNGIYITAIYVDCTVADPVTEIDANIMYCDAVAGAAFPGANATLIKAVDTTTGNFSDAAVNTTVPTGKTIYLDLDADPVDANTQYHIRIHYRIEEDN